MENKENDTDVTPADQSDQSAPVVSTVSAVAEVEATTVVATDAAEADVQQTNTASSLWKRWTGQTRAYLAEYAVLLIVLSSLIYLVAALFSGIIDHFGVRQESWYWSGGWAYKTSIAELAATVALIPVLVLLTKRTSGTEEAWPAVRQSNWRKAFLGIFLISLGVTAIGYTVGFIYVVVSALSNAGLAVDTDNKVWQALVKNIFAIALFGLSALLYARDYRPIRSGNLLLWRRIHRYGLVLFAIVAVIVFTALPLGKQRAAYVDDLVVGDLNTITSRVSSYASNKRQLPASLSDVELSDQVKTRSKNLKYEFKPESYGNSYQLCATFKTDASNKKDDNPIRALSGASSSALYEDGPNDSVESHKKGYQCFKKTAYGVRTTSSTSQPKTTPSTTSPTYDDYDYDDY